MASAIYQLHGGDLNTQSTQPKAMTNGYADRLARYETAQAVLA